MIPERKEGENIFEFVLRAASELRENRHLRLEAECQRIEHKARRHGNAQEQRRTQDQQEEAAAPSQGQEARRAAKEPEAG